MRMSQRLAFSVACAPVCGFPVLAAAAVPAGAPAPRPAPAAAARTIVALARPPAAVAAYPQPVAGARARVARSLAITLLLENKQHVKFTNLMKIS